MADESDYWNALDKRGVVNPEKLDINPNRVGISHGIGDVGEGLKANVFRGATAVELGFMGRGKGYRSQPTGATPESFGSVEREDIRQLAKINEVELSTHAAPDLGRPSGIADDQSSFNDAARANSLHEIERAISFAADTAEGGAVVVHLGEFPRAIFDADEQEGRFEAHPDEKKKAPVFLVDERTGQIQNIRRDLQLPVPMEKKDKDGKPLLDENGHPEFERDEHGAIKFGVKKFENFAEEARKLNKDPGKHFFDEYFQKQKEQFLGDQLRWTGFAERETQNLKEMRGVLNTYEESLKKSDDKEGVKGVLRTMMQKRNLIPRALATGQGDFQGADEKKYLEEPAEYLKDQIKAHEREYQFAHQASLSSGRSKKEIEENMKNLKPIQEYGVRKAADTISNAAMTAYKIEKSRGFDKPLFISPENWNPESYGNHPREYKHIILESRKAMQVKLKNDGYGEQEAKKIAKEHIKGTFDVGHMNFWKKYFKPSDPSAGPEEVDKEFRNWIDKEAKMLADAGVIGNVHLSDNFGYHDEHLTPGEGNAPIEKFVKRLEEKGYAGKYIGEVGGQKEGFFHQAWTGTLNTLHSPIYRTDGRSGQWQDIEHAYFGLAPQSPNFLVGDLVPSKDWSLWSETPLE